jgi:hypothetical protein
VNVTARNVESGVVVPDSLFVRTLEQAVDLAIAVVKQLDLANAERVDITVASTFTDSIDRFLGQLQVVVKIHELWHDAGLPSRSGSGDITETPRISAM